MHLASQSSSKVDGSEAMTSVSRQNPLLLRHASNAPEQEPITRSAFEAWARWFVLDVKRNAEGAYTNWTTQAAWHSWIAARNIPSTQNVTAKQGKEPYDGSEINEHLL